MYKVVPRLYLSDRCNACCPGCLSGTQITHILTVDTSPWSRSLCGRHASDDFSGIDDSKIVKKFVRAVDEPTFNILEILDDCIEFLDVFGEASECHQYLVHCWAGQSRSAAVVLAVYMKRHRVNVESALEFLRTIKSDVRPNSGFVNQLHLFEKLNWKVDTRSPIYKQFSTQLQRSKLLGCYNKSQVFKPSSNGGSKLDYCFCRLCRKVSLVSSAELVWHGDGSENCSSYYLLEPEDWMKEQMSSDLKGKLNCPSCRKKLGAFSWAGLMCNCGEMISPAFQINKARVDTKSKASLEKLCA